MPRPAGEAHPAPLWLSRQPLCHQRTLRFPPGSKTPTSNSGRKKPGLTEEGVCGRRKDREARQVSGNKGQGSAREKTSAAAQAPPMTCLGRSRGVLLPPGGDPSRGSGSAGGGGSGRLRDCAAPFREGAGPYLIPTAQGEADPHLIPTAQGERG